MENVEPFKITMSCVWTELQILSASKIRPSEIHHKASHIIDDFFFVHKL